MIDLRYLPGARCGVSLHLFQTIFLSYIPEYGVEHSNITFWIGHGELERDVESNLSVGSLWTFGRSSASHVDLWLSIS